MQEFHLDASRFGYNLYNGDPDFSVIPNTHPQAFPYGQGKWIRGISQKKSAFKRNNSKKKPQKTQHTRYTHAKTSQFTKFILSI